MKRVSVLSFCFLLGLLTKGLSAAIQTEQDVLAAVGGQAALTCQLTKDEDVLQITWQKILPDGEKNLATYTKRLGQRVNPDLERKMDFQYEELQSCSVVIREVTDEDEGCYRCLFNTYPKGAVIGRTCLRLYELHQPVLHVRESKSPGESLVSCSATGRPAPTVTLTVTQQHLSFSQHNTTTVHNNNNTVTVTTTAVLSGLHDDSTQVGCAVRVLSGPQMEVIQRIAELQQTSADGLNKQRPPPLIFIWIIGAVLTAGLCVLVIIGFRQHKTNKIRDPERNKTSIKTPEDSQQIKTPLIHQKDEVRQRSSVKKSPENNCSKPSHSVKKQLVL